MKSFTLSLCLLLFTHLLFSQNQLDRNKLLDFYQSQQYEDAIRYLRQLHAEDSTNVEVLNYLGYSYSLLDDPRSAALFYLKTLQIDSANISANQNFASINSDKNPELARQITLRLIRLQPGKALHYRQMGNLLVRDNLRDSAKSYFQTAYDIAPLDSKNIAALAEVLIDLKNYRSADSILAAGRLRDSMNIAYLILSIQSAYQTDQFEKTLDPGEKLMQLGEVPLKSLLQVVLSYYNLKKYIDCIRISNYLRNQEIENEAINYYEAKAWAKLKDFDRSNELLRHCIASALSKQAQNYYYALADNYEELHKYKTAIAHYDTAYYLFRDPLMTYNIGRIYETKLKNRTVAEKYFKRYLMYADTSTPERKKVYHFLDKRYAGDR